MKLLTKRLLAGALAVAAIFIWQASQPPEVDEGAGKKAVSVRKQVPPLPGQSPDEAEAGSSPTKAALSQEEILALIHVKMHRWLEVQASGGDDNDHSLEEMEVLLAKGNAMDIIQSLSPEELNTPFGMEALQQWMQTDLAGATDWVAANPDAMEDLTAVLAQGWASDPADLEDYLDQVPDSAWKQNFLLEAGSQLKAKNPQEAISLAQQMTSGSAQTNFLQSVACDWIGSDPAATLDWIKSVDDPALQEQLIAAAAKSYALTDPDQAAAWLVAAVKSEDLVNDAALNILSTWVTKDPLGAANWAMQFPEGDTKNTALNLVSNYWLQTDPQAASLWMQNPSQGGGWPGEQAQGAKGVP